MLGLWGGLNFPNSSLTRLTESGIKLPLLWYHTSSCPKIAIKPSLTALDTNFYLPYVVTFHTRSTEAHFWPLWKHVKFSLGNLANLGLFNETLPFHLSWWKWVAISYFLGFLGLLLNVDIWLHNRLQLPMDKESFCLLTFATTWKPITNKTSCMIIDHLNSSNLLHFLMD